MTSYLLYTDTFTWVLLVWGMAMIFWAILKK